MEKHPWKVARACSCGSNYLANAIRDPNSETVVECRCVGLGLSKGRIPRVLGKIRGDNCRITGTCTDKTSSTSGIYKVANQGTIDMNSKANSDDIDNTVENCRNSNGVGATLKIFSSVREEVNVEAFGCLEEQVRKLTSEKT